MAAAVLAAGSLDSGTSWGGEVQYVGYQYDPGSGDNPPPWPTDGSFFHTDLWLNNLLPGASDTAIFGADWTMDNGNTAHAPHILHLGNFGYYGTTTIAGGSISLSAIRILRDDWTFDFASGQTSEFTGTLVPSVGRLTVGTLAISATTSDSASLALKNGTLTANTLQVADQGGQGFVMLTSGARLIVTSETIGALGSGIFIQSGGTHNISGSLLLGANNGAKGGYTLTSGALSVASREYVGYSGNSSFVQAGGTHTVSSYLYLGYSAGSTGTYSLSNGQLTAQEVLGYSGTGSFTQTGGTHAVAGTFYLGYNSSATAVYDLCGGQLKATSEYDGYSGSSSFNQDGGTHTVLGSFTVGHMGIGSYTLQNGLLTVGSMEYVGTANAGHIAQSGGIHSVSGTLMLGNSVGAIGMYDLNSGQLTTASEVLGANGGVGSFTQQGGTHTIGSLSVNSNSRWSLTGGTVQLTGGLSNAGSLILGGTATFGAGGMVDLSQAFLQDVSKVTLTVAANSLLVLPAGVSTEQFGAFTNNGGIIGNAGSPIMVPAGNLLILNSGSCHEAITCAGTITGAIDLHGDIQVQGDTANVTLSNLWVTSNSSRITGGQLRAGTENLGYSQAGGFVQEGGNHSITQTLYLGYSTGIIGSYTLSGGQLTASNEYMGWYGSGNFSQTGGVHNVSGSLLLGLDASAVGNYTLTNGHLTTNAENLQFGTFSQTGGTHTSGNLGVSWSSAVSITGGTLQLTGAFSNSGRFVLGGTAALEVGGFVDMREIVLQDVSHISVTVNRTGILILPSGINAGDFGNFTNNGGLVATAGSTITIPSGAVLSLPRGNYNESFICSGTITGAASLQGGLEIRGSTGSATLESVRVDVPSSGMDGGRLTVTYGETIGAFSDATFYQTGGSHTISGTSGSGGTLSLGLYSGIIGGYVLNNGQLGASQEYIGNNGTGSVVQTGGTHTVYTALLGYNLGASGTYVLSGGQLSVGSLSVGATGAGNFIQLGGVHKTSELLLGSGTGAVGTYSLSNGELVTTYETVGRFGSGTFTQTGGINTTGRTLSIGFAAGATGVYILDAGVLSCPTALIGYDGAGTYCQTGGTHTAGSISIGYRGTLILTGGMLEVTTGLTNAGSMVLGGTAVLHASGVVDMGQLALQEANGVTLTLAAKSLLILPAETTTSQFGNFVNNGGVVGHAGSAIAIPAGIEVAAGTREFLQPFVCAGTIMGSANFYGGIQVQGSAGKTNVANIRIDDLESGMDGGQVQVAASEFVGYAGKGLFLQTGGTHSVAGSLHLGFATSSTGTYVLSGGVLTVARELIGPTGTGTFSQTGGTHTVGALSVGPCGLLEVTGGTLRITDSLTNSGSIVLAGSAALDAGGLVDLSKATIQDLSGLSLALAPESLIILPAGFPLGQLGSFTNSGGIIGYAGATVVIPAGAKVSAGSGSCYESVLCSGTLKGAANLYGGIYIQDEGSANATVGMLTTDASSGMTMGTLTVNSLEYLGYSGTGSFTQSGGAHVISGSLCIGHSAMSRGVYLLSGGVLSAATEYLGSSGSGSFAQTGGSHTAAGTLVLGLNNGAEGSYSLTAGQLAANSECIGYTGMGRIDQSGGIHTVAGTLSCGYNSGSAGTYTLSNGALTASNEYQGLTGNGNFKQMGGTHTISGMLFLGYNNGAVGSYTLTSGQLSVRSCEYIGSTGIGDFIQTGGTHTVGTLSVSPNSLLNVAGGTLQVTGGLSNAGTVVLGGTTTVNVGGMVDLGQAIMGDMGQVSLSLAPNSLLILPSNTSPGQFADFINSGGLVGYAGLPIAIPPESSVVAGGGSCHEQILAQGTVTGAANLYGGIQVYGSAASVTVNTLRASDATSGITGGQLNVTSQEYLGYSGDCQFAQTGGTHTVSGTLVLGCNTQAVGSYTLSGGLLSVTNEYVGNGGTGCFIQTGGIHTVSDMRNLYIGLSPNGVGSYYLSDGLLAVGFNEYLGVDGTGVFTQAGGTHTIGFALYMGLRADSSYLLTDGQLSASNEIIGVYDGGAHFIQSGGIHIASLIQLGYHDKSSGTYDISNGTLFLSELQIGCFKTATGTFNQSGGVVQQTVSKGSIWYIAGDADENNPGNAMAGVYNISGGALIARSDIMVGTYGKGLLNQSGGTIDFSGSVCIGRYAGSTGQLCVSGGTLNVNGGGNVHLTVGEQGTGTFTISTGGVVQLTATLGIGLNHGGNPGNGTVNLDGGTLTVPGIYTDPATVASYFNFNGGILRSNASNATFLQGLTSARIKAGGAIIDTNGYDIVIAQTLQPEASSRGGALIKQGTGTLTLSGSANSVDGLTIVAGNLSLQSGLKVNRTSALPGTPERVIEVAAGGLSLGAAGSLDLTNHDLILHYAPGDGAATLAATLVQMQTGKLASSTLGSAETLVCLDNAELATPFSNFDGIALADSAEVLLKYTWKGDADLDGRVTFDDYLAIDSGYLFGGSDWLHGDFDGDHMVTAADYVLIDVSFLAQNPVSGLNKVELHRQQLGEAYESAWAETVPEPATLVLLMAGSASLLRRQRTSKSRM